MRLFEESRSIRGVRRAYQGFVKVGRDSLPARGVVAVTHALGRWAPDSFTFNTGRIRSLPLESLENPASVLLLGRPYLGLRRVLRQGRLGKAIDRMVLWAGRSDLRSGVWLRLVGALFVGMACGLAPHATPVASILLGVSGLVLLIWGPPLLTASGHSLVFGWIRGDDHRHSPAPSSLADQDRSKWLLPVASLVFLAAGVATGLVDDLGPLWLAAGIGVVTVAGLLVWRAEAVLLVAAAYPWVDALMRAVLGDLGGVWDEAFLLLCVLLLAFGTLLRDRLRLRTVPIALPALFVLLAAVASVVVGRVPSNIGIYALRIIVEPLLFYFVGFLFFTSTRWLRLGVGVFLTSTTALALHGILQYLTGVETPKEWVDSSETGITTRAFSILGNPNELGVVLALGAIIAIAFLLARDIKRPMRGVFAVVAAIQLTGLAFTFSRSAMIGFIVGLFAMLMLAHRRLILPTAILGVAGALAMPRFLWDRFALVFSNSYLHKAAIDGRTYRWTAALDQMGAHPWFGVGLGMFGGATADQFNYWDMWVDNYYLQMGAEAGLLFLVAFLWLLLRVGRGLVRSYRAASDSFVVALAAGMFGGLVIFAVSDVFVSLFESPEVVATFWLLAGLTTSAALTRTNGADT